MTCAVVPVKILSEAKSRLLPNLDRSQREALSLAMLRDVLTALQGAPSVARIVALTPDATVAKAAREAGAEALERPDTGLNPAIDDAARDLGLGVREPYLVVLGDVAGATSDDLEALCRSISLQPGPAVALAPARDGGSAALLRTPHQAIPAHFGPDSASAHRDAARRAGVVFRELELPSLGLDLDCVDDLEHFLLGDYRGSHTREVLASLPIRRRA